MACATACVLSEATILPQPAANCAHVSRITKKHRRFPDSGCASLLQEKASSLACLWQLTHRAQETGADIHCARRAVDFQAAAMHVQHKAAASAALRKADIVSIHRLTLTYFTTT